MATLTLAGIGAAYIRVSDDRQDTDRQHAACQQFADDHNGTIPPQHWFEDHGWARDTADKRPDFQRLLERAEAGAVQWIVVDAIDRFGTKSAKQLFAYLHRLEEAGCKLYDVSGKEWTGEDDATEIAAWVGGKTSAKEQRDKSHRTLSGKLGKAKAGEWQGGPVRLGFDVACYNRATGNELWRVVIEGRGKRVKIFPDGRTERFDGRGNFPKCQNDKACPIEFFRIVPSRDKAKRDAAVAVFKRFANEAVGFVELAHYLTRLGFRNGFGNPFDGPQINAMLEDPCYRGRYAWNKRHSGKFSRLKAGRIEADANFDEHQTKNPAADWIVSDELFPPLVDEKTWDAVQAKLDRPKRAKAPRSAKLYLAGLVVCGTCGGRMVCTADRMEYYCGTYHKARRLGEVEGCTCQRNSVFHASLVAMVDKWLAESGTKLTGLLAGLSDKEAIRPIRKQYQQQMCEAIATYGRMWDYLHRHHDAAIRHAHAEHGSLGVAECVEMYRAHFSVDAVAIERKAIEAEYDALTEKHLALPAGATRAREKVGQKLTALQKRINALSQQQANLADRAADHRRRLDELKTAIADAKAAKQATGEHGLRQRAQALARVIGRIECQFAPADKPGAGGWRKRNSRLTRVTIYPRSGEPMEFPAPDREGSKSPMLHGVSEWALTYHEVPLE